MSLLKTRVRKSLNGCFAPTVSLVAYFFMRYSSVTDVITRPGVCRVIDNISCIIVHCNNFCDHNIKLSMQPLELQSLLFHLVVIEIRRLDCI